MRIAMFGHKRIPSREGGVEVVVEELSTRMAARGHSVTCYNRRGHHVAGAQYDADIVGDYQGVRLKNVFTVDKKGIAAMSASFFAAVSSALGRYDVVHIHAEGPAFMCWLPKLFGKRVIVTVHGLDHQRAKWGRFASWYILSGEKNAVRYADEIIVLSRNVQEYFRAKYGRETVFIPNGTFARPQYEADEIRRRWGLEKDSYILFLGRIVPEKGIQYLAEAFRNIHTDKKLVIAGSASDTNGFVQELKKLTDGDSRIIYTGFVQGQPKHELFSNAYVYVLPSDLEGMPLTLLGAMSYGTCCLVSDIPECAEVVEDKAVLFRKSNPEDLQEKLQMLCDNPKLVAKLKKQSSDFICGKYNWDDIVERTLRLYEGA